MFNLFIILPILLLPYDCGIEGLFLKAVSRTLRLFKIEVFIKRNEGSVTAEFRRIVLEMILIILISTVLFMVIENYLPNEADLTKPKYDFMRTIYFIVVTVTTVGYGDYSPETMFGRVFIALLILQIIIYKLPNYISNITELTSRNSPYSVGRVTYKATSEVPHIVICG